MSNRSITGQADWSRELITNGWQPSRQLLRAIRRYQSAIASGTVFSRLSSKYWVFMHRFWSTVCGCDIPINSQIGGGLLMPHPSGIVIHPGAKIGPNCLLLQQVTLVEGVELDWGVDIGAGAKIIAPVKLGARSKIGANAVVLTDVPPGKTAVGVPAKII